MLKDNQVKKFRKGKDGSKTNTEIAKAITCFP